MSAREPRRPERMPPQRGSATAATSSRHGMGRWIAFLDKASLRPHSRATVRVGAARWRRRVVRRVRRARCYERLACDAGATSHFVRMCNGGRGRAPGWWCGPAGWRTTTARGCAFSSPLIRPHAATGYAAESRRASEGLYRCVARPPLSPDPVQRRASRAKTSASRRTSPPSPARCF